MWGLNFLQFMDIKMTSEGGARYSEIWERRNIFVGVKLVFAFCSFLSFLGPCFEYHFGIEFGADDERYRW